MTAAAAAAAATGSDDTACTDQAPPHDVGHEFSIFLPIPRLGRTLAFEVACTGDVLNTLKRIDRCVEVFVRYPGLCRSMMG